MRTADQYKDQLLALLPQGDAWPKEADSELSKLMHGLGEELARIDTRAIGLLNESHPSQAFELFSQWQQQYGLPDNCSADLSFQEQRAALLQKYRQHGGQSREFFIEIAKTLGYEITITEYQMRTFGGVFGDLFGHLDWNFVWQVNASTHNYQERVHGQSFGDTYRAWGNQRLECVLNKLVHAHRTIIFSYS